MSPTILPTSRNHSSLHSYGHPISTSSASSTISNHIGNSITYSSGLTTTTPTKYDFSQNFGLLHSTPTSLSAGSVAAASGSTNNNGTSASNPSISTTNSSNNYMHSNNLQHSSYANVKSEANYDYMNTCLQGGYFSSSFGSLGAAPGGGHPAADLAGYHHQHNVIQAAKLMASS